MTAPALCASADAARNASGPSLKTRTHSRERPSISAILIFSCSERVPAISFAASSSRVSNLISSPFWSRMLRFGWVTARPTTTHPLELVHS